MPQNLYELLWIFMIYAFLGWCTEVSYAALDTGKFVNRGFLNGPYCPIYGCGVVIVVAVLTPLKENLFLLFAGSFLLTTVLEYITGDILERVFHNKWWDYTDKPFNIKGYVCLKFSIFWGLACTFIMDILHPMIYAAICWIPFFAGAVLLGIILCIFVVDCVITVLTILRFNRRLKVMDEMGAAIHRLSDEIGENIYEGVTDVVEKSGEFQENHPELVDKLNDTRSRLTETADTAKTKLTDTAETAKTKLTDTAETAKTKLADTAETAKTKLADTAETAKTKLTDTAEMAKTKLSDTAGMAKNKLAGTAETAREVLALEEKKTELAELKTRYEKMFEEKNAGFRRLLKAFPDMKSSEYNEMLQKFRLYFSDSRDGRKKKNPEEEEK